MPQSLFVDEDIAGGNGPRDVTRALCRQLMKISPAVAVLAVVDLHPETFLEAFAPLIDTGTEIIAFSTAGTFSGNRIREGRPAAAALCFDGGVSVAGFDANGQLRTPMAPDLAKSAVVFSTQKLTRLDVLQGALKYFEPGYNAFTGGFVMQDALQRSWVWDRRGVHSSGFVALFSDQPGVQGLNQGMRLLGEPFLVTKSTGPWIEQLAFVEALERLEHALQEEQDEEESQLFVGFPRKESLGLKNPDHFLAHPVLGIDRDKGALKVPLEVPMGAPAQLMAKSPKEAHAGAVNLMSSLKNQLITAPGWGLLTSCCARNGRFFGSQGSDMKAATEALPELPYLGWYANGEFYHGQDGLELVQFSTVVHLI